MYWIRLMKSFISGQHELWWRSGFVWLLPKLQNEFGSLKILDTLVRRNSTSTSSVCLSGFCNNDCIFTLKLLLESIRLHFISRRCRCVPMIWFNTICFYYLLSSSIFRLLLLCLWRPFCVCVVHVLFFISNWCFLIANYLASDI